MLDIFYKMYVDKVVPCLCGQVYLDKPSIPIIRSKTVHPLVSSILHENLMDVCLKQFYNC
jgi:hypothetical protein